MIFLQPHSSKCNVHDREMTQMWLKKQNYES